MVKKNVDAFVDTVVFGVLIKKDYTNQIENIKKTLREKF